MAGLHASDIEPILADITSTVPTYLSKKADATYSTAFVQGHINEALPSRFLREADSGYSPPGYVLVAKQSYASGNAELVRRFVRAALRGFQAAKEDPEAAAAAVVADNPEVVAEQVQSEFEAMIPYFCSSAAAASPYGHNNENDCATAVTQIVEAAKLPSVKAEQFFTNEAFNGGDIDVAAC